MFKTFISIVLIIILCGCNKITPSGEFWKAFHENEIDQEKFDHGPYGGTTHIKWSKKDDSKFTKKEIVEFAEKNGWWFVDEAEVENVINSDDFSYSIINKELNMNQFKKTRVLRFHTNFLIINEDAQRDTQNNCFVILSENLDSLTVYYRWGDF
ncbi:hypothetical protein [Moheibacter sediminis]|uniref:Lipoprotein n=1 Tax=Moheibacter sediminis TaxID=1434700 RepID=A0A1W2AXI3_9FLAO|nr:hypothetical protein [Moheibacter sediminis]SMC65406.1 hypothetical protein SAMN06296427_105123 [Moheibacter sediminis]